MMRWLAICLIFLTSIGLFSCKEEENKDVFVNNYQDPNKEEIAFYNSFDEGRGNQLTEEINGQTSKIEYVFNDAQYKGSQDPKWNTRSAASGSCLAFDGYSNYIKYNSLNTINTKSLTIDVFICPRAFEWDAPNAIENGTESIQVVAGQYDFSKNAGFLIGMHKFGEYSFQIGLGDKVIKLWNEWNDLERYKWNHLTFTFDGDLGYMAIYKNGELVNFINDAYGEIETTDKPFYLGKSQNPKYEGMFELNMYNGLMDELKIYNKALSSEDIAKYHQSFFVNDVIKEVVFADAWLDEDILDDDIYRPKYHAAPPQHWMNEPHALFYYKGNYHLFYQFNLTGPYWRQICIGHFVSSDLVNWRNIKEAIIPTKNSLIKDGAWSGNASYKADGTPVLFITAGDDAKSLLQYSNQNIVTAIPADLNDPDLTNWVVSDELAVTHTKEMGRMNEFRDPQIYFEDGIYYMLVSASLHNRQGTALLFTTSDDSFNNWKYEGPLFTPKQYYPYMGSTWELVNLEKVWNQDKTKSKYLFAFSPSGDKADNDVYYYLGDFDKKNKKFIPEFVEPQLMDYGNNVFTGPTISKDKKTNRVLICSIIQGQRNGKWDYLSGYAHSTGIPRELSLGNDGNLKIKPIQELENLYDKKLLEFSNISLAQANKALSKIDENQLYIHVKIKNINSLIFGINLKQALEEQAVLTYEVDTKRVSIDTTTIKNNVIKGNFGGVLDLKDNKVLDIEIYIDQAMIEIYLNGSKTITAMVYNTHRGVSIFGDKMLEILMLDVQRMKRI